MKLTTKGRYAVMAVVELACSPSERPVRLSELAEKQKISLSYMEQLFAQLKKHGIVKSVRGPGGGYLLATAAAAIPVSTIVQAVESRTRESECSPLTPEQCVNTLGQCKTHPLWALLSQEIGKVLSSVTLADICDGKVPLPEAAGSETAGPEGVGSEGAGSESVGRREFSRAC